MGRAELNTVWAGFPISPAPSLDKPGVSRRARLSMRDETGMPNVKLAVAGRRSQSPP